MQLNNLIRLIKDKFESTMSKQVVSIKQLDNITNNTVYKIETESQPYIFKIYKNKSWPEDGKLMFVNDKLSEFEIPHARINSFCRDDSNFPNGYLIEECLPGFAADKLALTIEEEMDMYKKLADLVSSVHQIKLINYGYIGRGIACSETFTEFVEISYEYHINNLLQRHLFEEKELTYIKDKLIKRFDKCNQMQPVLCHGDLSKKNILMYDNKITIIDWDDAQSLCWIADIARLTLWMKFYYDNEKAKNFRDVFIKSYKTSGDKEAFFDLENTFHVWFGLDYMNYFVGTPPYEMMKTIFQEALQSSGM